MAHTISLRTECHGDGAFLYALFVETRGGRFAGLPLPPEQLDALLRMQYRAQRAQLDGESAACERSIVLLDGAPIGRLCAMRAGAEWRIVDIALLAAHRNKGIGTTLLRAVLDQADRAQARVRLRVAPGNPARRLYERLGFVFESDDGMDVALVRVPAGACNRAGTVSATGSAELAERAANNLGSVAPRN